VAIVEKAKEILTTGEVARICRVAPRTVSKWVDTGQLRGYRIPGSRDRRIPLQQLIRFMKAHGMPLDAIETGQTRILVVDREPDLTELIQQSLSQAGQYEVRVADSVLEAGAVLEQFKPHVLLVDVDLPGIEGRTIARFLAGHSELAGTYLIAMSASLTPMDRQTLLQQGFHSTLATPFDLRPLTEAIENVLGMLV
jgi:excisionase family DNA binding protein